MQYQRKRYNGGNNANANFTLIDESTGETAPTGTLAEGENITVQLSGQDITVEVNDVIGQSEVIVSYTYPTFIGFPDNSAIFFENLGLIIVVSCVMMIVGVLSVIGGEVKNVR